MEPTPQIRPARPRGQTCCCYLRWKGMFIDVEPDPSIPNTRDGFFWCSHTMNCLGPDGRVADEESCCHGRDCFDPI
jgi:hypothetical protein